MPSSWTSYMYTTVNNLCLLPGLHTCIQQLITCAFFLDFIHVYNSCIVPLIICCVKQLSSICWKLLQTEKLKKWSLYEGWLAWSRVKGYLRDGRQSAFTRPKEMFCSISIMKICLLDRWAMTGIFNIACWL